jgi:hypothetical protein
LRWGRQALAGRGEDGGADGDAVVEVLVRCATGGPPNAHANPAAGEEHAAGGAAPRLLSTAWGGERSSSGRAPNGALAGGMHATPASRGGGGNGGGLAATKRRVVEEWRELYRGDKNGCVVSQVQLLELPLILDRPLVGFFELRSPRVVP